MKPTFLVCVLSAVVSAAPAKPAAVQVCLELPAGTPLFSGEAKRFYRPLSANQWVLDFDVQLDGETPERLTRVNDTCFRAWLPPRPLKSIALNFDRVPMNFVAEPHAVDLKLKADLWFDAGKVSVAQQPFSVAQKKSPGAITFERVTSAGAVRESPAALPKGSYVVTYVPPPPSKQECTTTVEVVAMGTITKENKPALFAELVEHYSATVLPSALRKLSVACAPWEEAVVEVLMLVGVFVRPLNPKVSTRVIPTKAPRYELHLDGQTYDLSQPVKVTVDSGQRLQVTDSTVADTTMETPAISSR